MHQTERCYYFDTIFPKKDSWVRRWLANLCTLCMLAAAICCVPPALELGKAMSTDYSSVPTLSHNEYVRIFSRLRAELDAPATSPEEYYRTLADINRSYDVLAKFIDTSIEGKEMAGHYGLGDLGMSATSVMQKRYEDTFGQPTMARASVDAERAGLITPGRGGTSFPMVGVDWPTFGWKFLQAWYFSGLCALGYFILRFKLHGLRMHLEPLRLMFCAIFWIPCAFIYPERIDQNKQVKDALRTIGYLMGAAMSFSALAAKAAERRPEGDRAGELGNVRVLCADDLPKPSILVGGSVALMSRKVTGNGVVVHNGPVGTWDLSATLPTNVVLDFSGTRSLSGDRGSDENDYGVVKTWGGLTLGLNYYDIRPLGTSSGGDMISPTLQLSVPLRHGWSGTVHGEYDFLTHGNTDRNGYLLSGGLSRSDHLIHDLRLDQTLSAVYGEGPFGQERGLVARYEGTAKVPLAQKTSGWFKVKLWAPIMGARDRAFTWSASTGLSFAF